jgi:two-component system sensor histidine kinase KdpD
MIPEMNDTTVALSFLLLVLIVAAVSSRRTAIAASLVAFTCFNFFFLPPVGTFTIAKKDDLVALFALLAVSVIGSHLSHQARRRAEEALALAQQRNDAEMARKSAETKSALVASLSHALKTPLTGLTVAASNLGTPGLSDDERREQMQIVRTELDRLKRLFDNMVDMASVESRAMSAELEWVHPIDIVDAARQQVDTLLAPHPTSITGDTDQRLVHLDPRLTSAALAHVLENAAVYSPVGSPIAVDVRVASDRLVIAVCDHGPGLPPDEIDRIFERFYRGTGARNDRFGSGMGLAITRGLLAIQGGRIAAANHPGAGAVFTLEVPAATRAASELALDVA